MLETDEETVRSPVQSQLLVRENKDETLHVSFPQLKLGNDAS